MAASETNRRAIFRVDVGEDGTAAVAATTYGEAAKARWEADRARPARIQAGLRSLLGVETDQPVEYKARIREGRWNGHMVPEAGALVIDAAWNTGETRQMHRIWVDAASRIDEGLATELGAEAEFFRQHGDFLAEDLSDFTEKAKQAAIEETASFRGRELARLAMSAAA